MYLWGIISFKKNLTFGQECCFGKITGTCMAKSLWIGHKSICALYWQSTL